MSTKKFNCWEFLTELVASRFDSRRPTADRVIGKYMATSFLLYRDEHRHILNKEMEEFCTKMQEMGVACKAADFKEI